MTRIDDILSGLRKDAWSGYATQADMISEEIKRLTAERDAALRAYETEKASAKAEHEKLLAALKRAEEAESRLRKELEQPWNLPNDDNSTIGTIQGGEE